MSKTSESKIRKALEGSKLKGKGSFVLALIIITAAFILIGAMLSMEHSLTTSALDQMSKNPQIFTNTTHTQNFKDTVEKIQQSNISVFNILLPVFGAWVGAVVAFHFGKENLNKAQETIKTLSRKPEDILKEITIAQLLNDYPTAKNVISFTIKDTIKTLMDEFKVSPQWPLLIVNDKEQQKPLGMLYRSDLQEALLAANLKPDDSKSLEDIIKDEKIGVKDFITNKKWTVDRVKNFAELKLNYNLLVAQSLMKSISDHPAVRGVVIENERAVAIVDYEMISSKIK